MARVTNLAEVRQARSTMGLGQFAESLGRKDAGDVKRTLESTEPFHEAYHTKLEGETGEQYTARRQEMRDTWIVRYVKGRCGVTEAEAKKIVKMTRVQRNKKDRTLELAVNTAAKGFSTHVVRPEAGAGKGGKADPIHVTREQASAIKSVVREQFDGDWDAARKAFAQLAPKKAKA